jgi:hypothetical protein
MIVFLFVGLKIITISTHAPFLCFMVGDPENPTVKKAIESIETFVNYQNCTQLHMCPSHRTYLSENMPLMVPVDGRTGELHELLGDLNI